MDILALHKESAGTLGFWQEQYAQSVYRAIEGRYNKDTVRNYMVSNLVHTDDPAKVLVKWVKRFAPLTDEELKERYGV